MTIGHVFMFIPNAVSCASMWSISFGFVSGIRSSLLASSASGCFPYANSFW